jgi:uncharacterized membrane protein YbhN (UPF0104 family)
LIAALPVTPGGLGTTQALQVLFFSPYGSAPAVLAFSLVHHAISLIVQAGIGFGCWRFLRRREV